MDRADRRRRDAAAGGTPRKPAWLDGEAARLWRPLVAQLEELGILARVDQVTLALLCQALADYLAAREVVAAAAAEGTVRFCATTDKGNIIQHPAVGVMNKAWERVVKLAREFGMTPSARVGLANPGAGAVDPITELIQRRYGSSN